MENIIIPLHNFLMTNAPYKNAKIPYNKSTRIFFKIIK
jgi:hypothetical protein